MPAPEPQDSRPTDRPRRRRATIGLAAAGLVALGVAAGAGVVAETRPSVEMAPVVPIAIHSLSSDGIVTIRGRVAEIYGNKFVMADASGRALVDTGRDGDRRQLVAAGEPVTIQGRFERGFVHAAFLIGPDSKVVALGPLGEGPHGHGGPHGRDREHDGPPPPPPADAPPAGQPDAGVADGRTAPAPAAVAPAG